MGDNAVVTIEECDTGIACDGLVMPSCETIVTTTPIDETTIDREDVTIDPNAVNVNPVSENPGITDDTSSGNILKAFGFIIAVLAMFV